jgi:hypothetical protein
LSRWFQSELNAFHQVSDQKGAWEYPFVCCGLDTCPYIDYASPIDELDPQVLIVRHKGQHHD